MAAAAMPIAAAYKNFIFTIVFFAFAHALKLSINPKCLYHLSQKIAAGAISQSGADWARKGTEGPDEAV